MVSAVNSAVDKQLERVERDTQRASTLLSAANARLEQLLQDAGVTVTVSPPVQSRVWLTTQRAHWRCVECDTHWSGIGSICPICHAGNAQAAIDQPPRDYAIAWYRDD